MEADKWYPTSKTYSYCGAIKKDLKLRDFNALINLLKYKLA